MRKLIYNLFTLKNISFEIISLILIFSPILIAFSFNLILCLALRFLISEFNFFIPFSNLDFNSIFLIAVFPSKSFILLLFSSTGFNIVLSFSVPHLYTY